MTAKEEEETVERAKVLLDLGRPEQARGLLLPLIATDGASASVWCHLVACDLAMGNWRFAHQASERAIAADPEAEWAYRMRSRALGELGLHGAAIEAAERAVALAPNVWQGHVQLADAIARSTREQGSVRGLEHASRAVELAPTVAATHLSVGLANAALHRDDEAEAAYRRVLELEPGNAAARNNLGVLALRGRGGAGRAAEHFVGSLRAEPSSQVAAGNVAVAGRVLLTRMTMVASVCAVLLAVVWRVAYRHHPAVLALVVAVVVGYVLWVRWLLRRLPSGVLRTAWPGWSKGWSIVATPLVAVLLTVTVVTMSADDLSVALLPALFILARLGSMLGITSPRRRR